MLFQARNSALKLIIFISLIAFIAQSACKPDKVDISNENKEFISMVIGDWTGHTYQTYNNDTTIYLIRAWDSLFVIRNFPQQTGYPMIRYSLDDPFICTLPYIENMQNWKIIQNNDNLFLETQDLCGNSDNFNIYFSNIYFHKEYELWGRTVSSHYTADLKLTNQYTEIAIDNLILDQNPYNVGKEITFWINHSFIRLVRYIN